MFDFSSMILCNNGVVENFLAEIDKFVTGLSIKLNEVSLKGDKTLSEDILLQFDICNGKGVVAEGVNAGDGDPTALTSRRGEKT